MARALRGGHVINPKTILAQTNQLFRQKMPGQAELMLRQALKSYPRDGELHHQLAVALTRQGKLPAALEAAYNAALLPPLLPAHANTLASLLHMGRRLYEAELWAQRGLEIDPAFAPLHNTMGTLLSEQHRVEEACEHFRRALDLQPGRYDSNINLARLLARLGRPHEALEFMSRVAAMRPDDIEVQSGHAFDLNYADTVDPREVLETHRRLGALYDRRPGPAPAPFANDRDPQRRLRVAFLSADYRGHSVSYFFEPIAHGLDREKFELFIYSNNEEDDHVTRRIREYPGQWRDTRDLSDPALLELARRDQIDILVDLSGLTIGHRLSALAKRLAPVQINYLGYPNTTGLAAMDYRIVDETTDPPGDEWMMTEKPLRLPGCFLCYRAPASSPPVSPPPALQAGRVTFGSFNNLAKISPTTIDLWAGAMRRVPGSRLILRSKILSAALSREHLRDRFAKAGIEGERVDLLDHVPGHSDHMALYGRVDIALDSYPYHGTTTTCEALWMGVPVVTLQGRVHAARVSGSLLKAAGMAELIAHTAEEFVGLAAGLAADPAALARRRADQRDRLRASALCDEVAFVRKFEEALRSAWRSWCGRPAGGAA